MRLLRIDCRLAAILGTGLLAGCIHAPPVPLDPAAGAKKLADRTLYDREVLHALEESGLAVPPRDAWTLDALTVAAWTLRPEIAVATATVESKAAAVRVAGLRPNPSLTLAPERVVSGTDSGVSPWVVAAALTVPLELAGRRDIRAAQAVDAVNVERWKLAGTLWSVRAEVRQALVSRLLAGRAAAIDADEVRLRKEFLAWVDTRIRFGAASAADRLTPQQALSEAEARRDHDNAEQVSAAVTLARAVGVSPDNFAAVQALVPDLGALPELTGSDRRRLRSQAVLNRTDVRGALAAYDAAEQDLKLEVAKQYPDIALGPGYSWDQGDDKIMLSLDLPIPLFHGARAAIDVALAERRAAASRFEAVQAGAMTELAIGLARYRASLSALANARVAAAAADRAATDALKRRHAGAADRGETLAAEIDEVTRNRNVLDAMRAAIDALGRIESAVQRPIFPASALSSAGPIVAIPTEHEK